VGGSQEKASNKALAESWPSRMYHRGTRRNLPRICLLYTLALLILMATVSRPALAFTDVPTSHQFAKAIHDLSVRGIIGGHDDGTFRPDALVNRQQFAKMIVGALYLPVSPNDVCPFTDVALSDGDGLYPDHFVAVAVANGITMGYDATHFQPGSNINRAHVITVVVRALDKLYPGALKPYPAPWFVPGNWDKLSGEHLGNAKLAYYNSLLSGLDYFGVAKDPMTPMPRGEVAQVLYNMKKLLPDVEMSHAWGETVDFEGARVRVDAPVDDPGSAAFQPDEGKRFVAFFISIQNIGSVEISVNAYNFELRDQDGVVHTSLEFGSHLDDALSHRDLQPGESVEGWRVFEVPANAVVQALIFEPWFSDVALLVWR
jgi:hypothetical protein